MSLRTATKVVAIAHLVRVALTLALTPFVITDLWNETFALKNEESFAAKLLPWLFNGLLFCVFIIRIVLYTNLLRYVDHGTDIMKTLKTSRYCLYDLVFWTTVHVIGLAYLPIHEINSLRGWLWVISMVAHLMSLLVVFSFVNSQQQKCTPKVTTTEKPTIVVVKE